MDIQCSILLMLGIGYARWVPVITPFLFQFSIINSQSSILSLYPFSPDVAIPSVNCRWAIR
jgi:hypothetical protein